MTERLPRAVRAERAGLERIPPRRRQQATVHLRTKVKHMTHTRYTKYKQRPRIRSPMSAEVSGRFPLRAEVPGRSPTRAASPLTEQNNPTYFPTELSQPKQYRSGKAGCPSGLISKAGTSASEAPIGGQSGVRLPGPGRACKQNFLVGIWQIQ